MSKQCPLCYNTPPYHQAGCPRYKPVKITLSTHNRFAGMDIDALADLAMKLYGHPQHAASVIQRQLDTGMTEWLDILTQGQISLTHQVLERLQLRAQGKGKWREWDWPKYHHDYAEYDLALAHQKLGEPLCPAGSWEPRDSRFAEPASTSKSGEVQ